MKKYNGIVIAGPTAVGKTNMSIKLAKKLKAEIISADASQVYKKMDIGTAKITKDEMQGVKHHLIDVAEIGEDYSVGDFEKDVNEILNNFDENNKNILLVGGTGLYIRAITDGFSDLPSKNEQLRNELNEKSLSELQEQLKILDEKAYNGVDKRNKIRLVRAIEVCLLTGEKFSKIRTKNVKKNKYNFLKIFLVRDREELYNRINMRVDIMLKQGILDEVKYIYDNYKDKLHKISAIGYKEFFDYFDGKVSLDEVVENVKRESRRYAKRQMTWFRKETDYIIYNLSEITEDEVVENILEKFEYKVEK